MLSRIDRINAFIDKRKAELAKEKKEKEDRIKELLDTVRSWSTRLINLFDLGVYMYRNGVPLGPYDKSDPKYKENDSRMFVSNIFSHRVGFIIAYDKDENLPIRNRRILFCIGIRGEGLFGVEDLCFGSDGELKCPNNPFGSQSRIASRNWDDKHTELLEKFVRDFPKFEKDFYEYIDSL